MIFHGIFPVRLLCRCLLYTSHTVLTLQSEMGGLQVGVHTELDPPASDGEVHSLQRYLEITNLRQSPLSLTQVQVLGGGLFSQTQARDGSTPYPVSYTHLLLC